MTTNSSTTQWQYLEQRPNSWHSQLYLVGSKLRAHTVWSDMIINQLTPEEVADIDQLPRIKCSRIQGYWRDMRGNPPSNNHSPSRQSPA